MSTECLAASTFPATPEWMSNGGFVPVILYGVVVMFWGLAHICEEYCVASITEFCKRNKISDDIAGSIFIGTGLSLPVLFVSFVGLFVSNSAIGVGAVVGGNVFNHLITIASSVWVSPDKTMKLDAVVFTREMASYLISCLLLIWAVKSQDFESAFSNTFQRSEWLSCLVIPWKCSLVLVACYIFYCFFETYFYKLQNTVNDQLQKRFGSGTKAKYHESPRESLVEVAGGQIMQFLDLESNNKPDLLGCINADEDEDNKESNTQIMNDARKEINLHVDTYYKQRENDNILSTGNDPTPRHRHSKSNEGKGLTHAVEEGVEGTLLTNEITETDLIVQIPATDAKSSRPPSYSQHHEAPGLSDGLYNSLIHATTEGIISNNNNDNTISVNKRDSQSSHAGSSTSHTSATHNKNREMFAIPWNDKNMLLIAFYILVYPMRVAIYYTVPDVRRAGSENKAILSTLAGFLWLAIQSYILTVALTIIGNWLHIPGSVMGLTIAAWAANYPAHWSSLVVATDGYGDVASCNVYGSNVFNNFIGLGLPWLLYSVTHNGESYNALQDAGVVLSLICLIIIIILHYIVVAASNWVLKAWMIPPMAISYLAFIGYLCYFALTL